MKLRVSSTLDSVSDVHGDGQWVLSSDKSCLISDVSNGIELFCCNLGTFLYFVLCLLETSSPFAHPNGMVGREFLPL